MSARENHRAHLTELPMRLRAVKCAEGRHEWRPVNWQRPAWSTHGIQTCGLCFGYRLVYEDGRLSDLHGGRFASAAPPFPRGGAGHMNTAAKVCGFCKGGPVGDAATWLDGKPRPPAPCPRCGVTDPEKALELWHLLVGHIPEHGWRCRQQPPAAQSSPGEGL